MTSQIIEREDCFCETMINASAKAAKEVSSDAIFAAPISMSTSTSTSTSASNPQQSNTNDKGEASSSLASSQKDNEEWLELPEDFTPSKMDVIVGWARQNYHHGTYT